MSSDSKNKIKSAAQNQLTEILTMLFDSGDDSDLVVKCGRRTWNLHRVILRAGSEYFRKACKDDNFKEGATGEVELHDDDPQMAGLMLRFFYAHDYHIDDNGKPPLIAHVRMYAIADKYHIPLLKDLAHEKFAAVLMDITDIKALDIPIFVEAIEIIFNTTVSSDRRLRDAILPTLAQFKTQLRDSDDFVGLIMAGLGDGSFTMDVIDVWANVGTMTTQTWRCSGCNRSGSGLQKTCGHCSKPSISYTFRK